jgi:hypothetical protein
MPKSAFGSSPKRKTASRHWRKSKDCPAPSRFSLRTYREWAGSRSRAIATRRAPIDRDIPDYNDEETFNAALHAEPKTNDDLAMRLLGLLWTGASKPEIGTAAQALAARQRPDGGWAQIPNLASDAFATGESLYALHRSGTVQPSGDAYVRGVTYLLGTQFADGSWYVRSRAPKFQPSFQSGFPFDHDQWISAAATAWAMPALAPAGSSLTAEISR